MSGNYLFIADLHLDPDATPDQPEAPCSFADPRLAEDQTDEIDPDSQQRAELAVRFLRQAHGQQALYILGDLFEYWLGDDAGLPLYPSIVQALQSLSSSGCVVNVMHGNRDFLLGSEFSRATGVKLISEDEMTLQLADTPVLLMHGDTLCTDDVDYQRFRRNVRESRWQKQFLAKSVDERRHHAQALRAASHDASVDKDASIMDVNPDQVMERLNANDCRVLIHGHTHRPADHVASDQTHRRLVVGDWHPDHAQYVEWDGTEFHLKTFR